MLCAIRVGSVVGTQRQGRMFYYKALENGERYWGWLSSVGADVTPTALLRGKALLSMEYPYISMRGVPLWSNLVRFEWQTRSVCEY